MHKNLGFEISLTYTVNMCTVVLNSWGLSDITESSGLKCCHKYHSLNSALKYALGLVDPPLLPARQLPGIVHCI